MNVEVTCTDNQPSHCPRLLIDVHQNHSRRISTHATWGSWLEWSLTELHLFGILGIQCFVEFMEMRLDWVEDGCVHYWPFVLEPLIGLRGDEQVSCTYNSLEENFHPAPLPPPLGVWTELLEKHPECTYSCHQYQKAIGVKCHKSPICTRRHKTNSRQGRGCHRSVLCCRRRLAADPTLVQEHVQWEFTMS